MTSRKSSLWLKVAACISFAFTSLWWDGRILHRRKRVAGRINREIDAIVAEFHKRLPRSKAKSIGCVYCRSSSRFMESIGDQLHKVLEMACEQGVFIARDHVFCDTAVCEDKDRHLSSGGHDHDQS